MPDMVLGTSTMMGRAEWKKAGSLLVRSVLMSKKAKMIHQGKYPDGVVKAVTPCLLDP